MERIAGKLGRLPKKPVGKRFALKWVTEYLTSPIPPAKYPVNVIGGVTNWGMLGNDQYGDCGEAGIRHYEQTTAAGAGQLIPEFTGQECIQEYFAFTGGQDTGVNLADFLLWLYKQGRIKAFAPVDIRSAAQVDACMQMFHGIYAGVDLTDDSQQLFADKQPWTVENGETPDPSMGHCIVKVAATGVGADDWVTWGAVQESTSDWTAACLDEAWVVVTSEEAAAKFTPDLLKDINALHGTGGEQADALKSQGGQS